MKKYLGNTGEQLVSNFLKKKNFNIIKQNYTVRVGEIDLIAEKDEYLIFVEVKTRRTEYFPTSTVITKSKQQKIIRAAKYFIMQNKVIDKVCRFDVATVLIQEEKYKIEYIKNAFFAT